MKRLTCGLILFLLTGCCGMSDPEVVPREPADGALDGISATDAISATDGQSDGGEVEPADGSVDPIIHPDPPAVTLSDEARRLQNMASQDPQTLAAAIDHFETTYDDRGLQVFLENREHDDAQVRRGAIYGLYTLFDAADERMLTAIQSALDDDDAIVRRLALKTMAIESFPRSLFLDATPRIAKHLDDEYEPDPLTRAQVARMLRRYQTSSRPALPALNDAIRNDPDYNVRSAALAALYDIARNAEEALPPPTFLLLNDPDPRLRRRAAIQLGRYRAGSAPSVPQLIEALTDDAVPARAADDPLQGTDEPVCIAAANALARIGKPAIQPLLEATQSEDRRIRLLSIRAIGDIGPDAKAAVEPLQALTRSSDTGVATAAQAALVRIGAE